MLRSLGPSGLLRLAAMVVLGLSLAIGCTAAVDRPLTVAVADDDNRRCEPDPSAALAMVCLEP